MQILSVVGARPNFMKIAPIIRAIKGYNTSSRGTFVKPTLVHTGQHYDYQMSQVFFQDLGLPQPDYHLGVGSGSHAEQTARVMIEVEKVFVRETPDVVVVVGDVNSTLAAALSAAKLRIPVAHVEAGLRSFDRDMPEEINRLLTDAISDFLFTPTPDANENLRREGIPDDKIFFVGNVMIDSLINCKEKAKQSGILSKLSLAPGDYSLLTLHRPSNVDEADDLLRIMHALVEVAPRIPIVFPIHPRTLKQLNSFGLFENLSQFHNRLIVIEPLGYIDFLSLEMNAKFVMTDSGGVQEETTLMGVPCITLRDNTERPITVTQGTNVLVGNDEARITQEALKILDGRAKNGTIPPLWDGMAAERIVERLCNSLA